MVSAIDNSKRILVTLVRTLAAVYGIAVSVTRDSLDAEAGGLGGGIPNFRMALP